MECVLSLIILSHTNVTVMYVTIVAVVLVTTLSQVIILIWGHQ